MQRQPTTNHHHNQYRQPLPTSTTTTKKKRRETLPLVFVLCILFYVEKNDTRLFDSIAY